MGNCDSNKKVNSKLFVGVSKTITHRVDQFDDLNKKIKLEFTILNCQINEKYQIKIEFLNENREEFFTEIVKSNMNLITFNSCYICKFFFEKQQKIKITVFKNGSILGYLHTYLGMIVGSRNSVYTEFIYQKDKEKISIAAYGISNCNTILIVNFLIITAQNVKLKNKISYMITSNERKVYQSESLSKFGQLKTAYILAGLLEPNFEITFFNSQKHKIISKMETLNSFTQENNNEYLTLNIDNNDYHIINRSQLMKQYSFIDYLKNGVQIGLSIGIDFTSSNGDIRNPNSLHYIGEGTFNDYEQAIKSCGYILAFYDYDQLFPVYGFGAIINPQVPKVDMCFNINFQQNPVIYTIDNVINEYRNCIRQIILAGPTEFCPIIRKEIDTILKENNPLIYHVLMILTDGVIVDQNKTIDAIVEASFLPFSLIIIGIGNDHFQEMVELDGDDAALIDSNGIKNLRDVVQFVPFNSYRNNPDRLAEKVLEEIPKQITEYYSYKQIYPNNLKMAQLRTKTLMEDNNINNY